MDAGPATVRRPRPDHEPPTTVIDVADRSAAIGRAAADGACCRPREQLGQLVEEHALRDHWRLATASTARSSREDSAPATRADASLDDPLMRGVTPSKRGSSKRRKGRLSTDQTAPRTRRHR